MRIIPQVNERRGNMKLNKISIDGFRNIKMSEIICSELVALVSLNSYGKSNLLQAIDFGVDFIRRDEDTKKDMMSWTKGIPLNKSMPSKDFRIEFEMKTSIDENTYIVLYGYKFKWVRDDDTGASIVGEWLKVKLDEKNQKYKVLIKRDGGQAFYRSAETGRCSSKVTIENNELIVNKLKAFDFLYYYDIIKRINSLRVYIERHLDASNSYGPDPIIRKNVDALEMEGNNLPRAVFSLKKQHPERYELLINSFMQLFPQITEIDVEEVSVNTKLNKQLPDDLPFKLSKEVYILYVNDHNLNQPINFEDMSDGAKRVFLLLTNIIIADLNNLSLIAVEEPENSIHPSLLQNYLRVVTQLLGETRIIITSHSPYIIQYLEPHNVYVGMPGKYGVAQFKRIRMFAQKALINDASNSEMSTGDYLFELLSGTEEDIKMIEQYLETENNE
ncbi:AAA family ATPase [Desulfosporosinus hippei]|nr:AAA family ATPase [Desulfosporosinus hippei]